MDRDARRAHYIVTRYASFPVVVVVRGPFGVYTYDGKNGEYRCLRYDIVYIDEADSHYGSDEGSPVSSASCKILTTAETEARGVERRKLASVNDYTSVRA